ncbi:uncharacterized protein LOC123680091 isoform X2 [Harmonia axyridis]|uniref:uncharacterized protein LOC123680091 isoform X2 n=1 Tax=Harmonia axyridis TaxID=115357 RepID=UPI001E2757B0|nr:uncharacterized protein LOC123680091 isoform X2 [Harmonia axyridis]
MSSNGDILGIYKRLVKLRETKKIANDRLRLLIRLTFDVMNFPPVKLCIFYVFCQYGFATSLTIYHLLDKFDQQTLMKHGSFCGIQIFVLINLGSIVFMADAFYEYLQNYKKGLIPLELLNENTLKQIVLLGNITKLICTVNMVLATAAALGFIAAPEYFNEKTYLSVWIQEQFPNYSNFMLPVVHWTSLPVALVMAGSSVAWAYAGMNAIFQIQILKEMINTVPKTTLPQKLRRDSQLYQAIVRQKLIICVMAHGIMVRFQNIACELLEPPLMMFSMGSVILGGSLMLEYLSNQEQNLGDQYAMYIGILCFALAGMISAVLYLIIGQAVKDESEGCNYLLRQLPWYDMNQENRKIFSIFLLKTEKPIALANSLVQVDYFLLMRVSF